MALIASSGVPKDAEIIDVGGGASTLVDCLLDDGYTRLAVLDLSTQLRARAVLASARGLIWSQAS